MPKLPFQAPGWLFSLVLTAQVQVSSPVFREERQVKVPLAANHLVGTGPSQFLLLAELDLMESRVWPNGCDYLC